MSGMPGPSSRTSMVTSSGVTCSVIVPCRAYMTVFISASYAAIATRRMSAEGSPMCFSVSLMPVDARPALVKSAPATSYARTNSASVIPARRAAGSAGARPKTA